MAPTTSRILFIYHHATILGFLKLRITMKEVFYDDFKAFQGIVTEVLKNIPLDCMKESSVFIYRLTVLYVVFH